MTCVRRGYFRVFGESVEPEDAEVSAGGLEPLVVFVLLPDASLLGPDAVEVDRVDQREVCGLLVLLGGRLVEREVDDRYPHEAAFFAAEHLLPDADLVGLERLDGEVPLRGGLFADQVAQRLAVRDQRLVFLGLGLARLQLLHVRDCGEEGFVLGLALLQRELRALMHRPHLLVSVFLRLELRRFCEVYRVAHHLPHEIVPRAVRAAAEAQERPVVLLQVQRPQIRRLVVVRLRAKRALFHHEAAVRPHLECHVVPAQKILDFRIRYHRVVL